MQKVLVAGATGYLGRFVTRELKRRGYWVRALARNLKKLEQAGPFLQPPVVNEIDDLFIGEVTKPETLKGLCDSMDIAFSSIGITRQNDKLTYQDVDYQGNRNILDITLKSSISKFIYVSVLNAHLYEHLAIVKAHEDFVRDLKACGIDYTIIRPTGYFSDMTEFLSMARKGRIYMVGNGENRINPIHGEDLAKVCADAINERERELPVGGPETYSMREIAGLAFLTLGKKPKITRIPPALAKFGVRAIRSFNKQMSDLVEFFISAGQNDGVAPATGNHSLKSFYEELASRWTKEKQVAD
ncbi:SDR family oxidoreductase [Chloroflexota bacterium]